MSETNILDGVFERVTHVSKVFKDRDVLRHDYVPGKLPHREDQIRQLGETIAPVRGAQT